MLAHGRTYKHSVAAFELYNRIQVPNEAARTALVESTRRAIKRKEPAFLHVNNRLEGRVLGTIAAMVVEKLASSRLAGNSVARIASCTAGKPHQVAQRMLRRVKA